MFKSDKSKKQIFATYISSFLPFSLLGLMIKDIPVIGYYHLVSDQEVLHIKHLYIYKNVRQFKDDLDFILRSFKPLSLLDFLDYLKTGQELPDKAFLLTVDDGLRETYDVMAPILLQKGVPAIFFVSSAFVDNENMAYDHKASLIIDQLRRARSPSLGIKIIEIVNKKGISVDDIEGTVFGMGFDKSDVLDEIGYAASLDFRQYLKVNQPYLSSNHVTQLVRQGFAIGGHGIDHAMYSSLSLEQQIYQTRISMTFVRERFGLDYGAFAFPHGDHGVSGDFFREIRRAGLVDISFGNAGFLRETAQNHFQRFSLEKPILPAEKILAFQFTRRIYRLCKGGDKVLRR